MLKLKLQYFGDLWKAGSSEKPLMLGKVEDRKQREQQSMRWFDGVISSSDMNWRKLWEIVEDRGACSAKCQDGHYLATEQQNFKRQPHEEGDPLRSRRSVRVPVGDYNTSENNLRKVWRVPGVQTLQGECTAHNWQALHFDWKEKNEGEGQAERAALKETVTVEGHSQPYWDPGSEE